MTNSPKARSTPAGLPVSLHRSMGSLRLGSGSSTRGVSVVTHAKKGKKKSAPEPAPTPTDEDDDFLDDEDYGDQDDDFLAAGADETDADLDAEGEATDTQGDASELMPASESDAEEGVLSTAVGYVQNAVANPAVRNLGILGGVVLAGSFALSVYNVYMRYNSSRSKRKRQVNKNVVVVERLRDFFPENRDSLTKGHIRGLQGKTGFKPEEIFRKYMRYKLNEEAFNVDFVADVLALKRACDLDGDAMKSVLMETGERMVKKYGILMRDVSDMGAAGVQRKVDGCSMFAKVMYLADLDEFIPSSEGKACQQRLKEVFGATDEDFEKLRISALGAEKADIDVLEAMGERMVKKYGILMRDVSDMGAAGVQRKVDGCSMFAKVMYLADLDEFIPSSEGKACQQRLKEVFGATDEDFEKLRISALGAEKADIDVLEAMITEKSAGDKSDEGGDTQGGEGGEPPVAA